MFIMLLLGVMTIMQNYLKERYSENTFELQLNYNISDLIFDIATKKEIIQRGYSEFIKFYKNKYGTVITKDTNENESLDIDDMIESLKDEINSNESC